MKDFFESGGTDVKVYERSVEEVELEPGNPKVYIRVKGLEEPVGVSFWVLVDPESGKIVDFSSR